MRFNINKSRFWPYYPIVLKQQKLFEDKLNDIKKVTDINEGLSLVKDAVKFAVKNGTGYYASEIIEDACLKIASTIKCDCEENPEPKSFLHVMTTAYSVGGHSRVVERWINLSPNEQKHSIVVTNQGDELLPQWLVDVCEKKSGKLLSLNEKDEIERAKKLRAVAMKYEYVILHVHMDDITPILAFGVQEFKRPVIIFNHADHLFWVGISIADVVVDFRSVCNFTKERRLASNVYCLGIPPETNNEISCVCDKNKIRSELGIPLSSFVILTTGAAYKYAPIGRYDFPKILQKVVGKDGKDIVCYAIGPSEKWTNWKCAKENTQRIIPLGIVSDRDLYEKYLMAADLYVDSFPMSGGTSIRDAVSHSLPVLSLHISCQENNLFTQNPFLNGTQCHCKDAREFVKKCILAYEDKDFRTLLKSEAADRFRVLQLDSWQLRLEKMINSIPKQHSIHSFKNVKGKDVVIDENAVLLYHFYKAGLMSILGEIKKRL